MSKVTAIAPSPAAEATASQNWRRTSPAVKGTWNTRFKEEGSRSSVQHSVDESSLSKSDPVTTRAISDNVGVLLTRSVHRQCKQIVACINHALLRHCNSNFNLARFITI